MFDDIVLPLYLSLGLVFLGASLAARPNADAFLPTTERIWGFGYWGGVLAALSCVAIAVVPLAGRAMLPVSTLFLVGSLASLALWVQSWFSPLQPRQIWRLSALVLALGGLNFASQAVQLDLGPRLLFQALLGAGLVLWSVWGVMRLPMQERTWQSHMVGISLLGLWVAVVAWSWVVYVNATWGGAIFLGRNVSEPWVGFVLRLWVFGFLLLAYISANGYALERMVRANLQTKRDRERAERLNEQLEELLRQKQELLQTVSFAARAQNFPAIMSSLSHEVNQPLGALMLNADYLLDEDAQLSAKDRRDVLEQVVKSIESAHQVIQDFRRFFGSGQSLAAVLALDVLLNDVLRALNSDFSRARVALERGAVAAVSVQGDSVQLESALTGVIQFMLGRSFAGDARRFFVESAVESGFVHVRVLANEPLLEAKEYEAALVRLPTEQDSRFSRGLWLARAIVEHHGGAMNVYADELWSGVCLQLPVKEA